MDKILVEVYVPASSQKHDVFIPLQSKCHEVTYLVANTASELSEGYFRADRNTVLCDRETGKVLDVNQTIKELQLKNGSKLMLL
jgi:hypothetical protein